MHAQRDKQVCSGQIKRRGKECEARGIPIHSSLCDMPPMGFWGLGKSNKGGVGTARKKKPFALCSYITRKKKKAEIEKRMHVSEPLRGIKRKRSCDVNMVR